jgi:hypothetical protein
MQRHEQREKKPIRVHPKCPLAYGTGPFSASACIDQLGKESIHQFGREGMVAAAHRSFVVGCQAGSGSAARRAERSKPGRRHNGWMGRHAWCRSIVAATRASLCDRKMYIPKPSRSCPSRPGRRGHPIVWPTSTRYPPWQQPHQKQPRRVPLFWPWRRRPWRLPPTTDASSHACCAGERSPGDATRTKKRSTRT